MSQVTVRTRRDLVTDALAAAPARRVVAIAVFVLLTAVGARLSVPLPGLVPVSLQTLVVLLAGLLLGPALGASAMAAYLLAGMAGLPMFVGGGGVAYLFGPTGGYLLAFPAAAAVTGALAARVSGDGITRAAGLALAATVGSIIVFIGGWAQLSLYLGDAGAAVTAGVVPFLAGSVAKIAVAVAIALKLGRPSASSL
ncbi:MAG: biotin transporter BioY [Gemmatimonadota bacterium]